MVIFLNYLNIERGIETSFLKEVKYLAKSSDLLEYLISSTLES